MEQSLALIIYLSSILLSIICGFVLLYKDYYNEKLTTYKCILIYSLITIVPIINTICSIAIVSTLIQEYIEDNIKIDINKKIFK